MRRLLFMFATMLTAATSAAACEDVYYYSESAGMYMFTELGSEEGGLSYYPNDPGDSKYCTVSPTSDPKQFAVICDDSSRTGIMSVSGDLSADHELLWSGDMYESQCATGGELPD